VDLDHKESLKFLLDYFGLEENLKIWPRLYRSLIHRSYRTEANLEEDNERLEFLGDSVIGLACTEFLLRENPESDEGSLSKLRATLVSRHVLGHIALEMNLGQALLLGMGEERSGGRQRLSILGSALEAVCGALYLSYQWERLQPSLVEKIIKPALILSEKKQILDHKSALQEWAQQKFQCVPKYQVVSEGGPDHLKIFEVQVSIEGKLLGKGEGHRKKSAENEAAKDALETMNLEKTSDEL
jgi:ribonuclease III